MAKMRKTYRLVFQCAAGDHPRVQCAAGDQCTAGLNNDVSNSTHRCYACGGRIHSHVFCRQLDIFLKENTHLLGTTLQIQTGVTLREDSSNETCAICFTCKQSLTNEDEDKADNKDDQCDVRGGTANINKDEDVSHQYAQRGKKAQSKHPSSSQSHWSLSAPVCSCLFRHWGE